MSELTCPHCRAENPSENTFCGACGARLRPESAPDLVSLVDSAVDKQMAAVLESRLKNQSVVEVEIAEKIAERTMKWAKLAGFFIGIPVTLLIGILAFFGIRTYSDLDNLVSTLDQTRDQIASAKTDSQNAKSEAEELLKQTQEQESYLNNQVGAVRDRLSKLEQELRSAENRIQQRQDRLEETVQDLIAGRISLGTKDPELSELFSQYLQYLDDIGFKNLSILFR
jgi:chromosome segregation ATPase